MAKKPHHSKKGGRTAMSADHDEKNAANGELREGANVDKIRDILFGSNMREYEKRFARLEERLTKSSDALRDDLKKRFDSLESYVKNELEAIATRLKAEYAARRATRRGADRIAHQDSRTVQGTGQPDPEVQGRVGSLSRTRSGDAAQRLNRSCDAGRSVHRTGSAAERRVGAPREIGRLS